MRTRLAVALAALAGLLTIGIAPNPANAASEDGVVNFGEFVNYYNPNFADSFNDQFFNVGDYVGHTFRSAGVGQFAPIKNNSLSVANFDQTFWVAFYTEEFNGGAVYYATPYATSAAPYNWYYNTLGGWALNIESHRFF